MLRPKKKRPVKGVHVEEQSMYSVLFVFVCVFITICQCNIHLVWLLGTFVENFSGLLGNWSQQLRCKNLLLEKCHKKEFYFVGLNCISKSNQGTITAVTHQLDEASSG